MTAKTTPDNVAAIEKAADDATNDKAEKTIKSTTRGETKIATAVAVDEDSLDLVYRGTEDPLDGGPLQVSDEVRGAIEGAVVEALQNK